MFTAQNNRLNQVPKSRAKHSGPTNANQQQANSLASSSIRQNQFEPNADSSANALDTPTSDDQQDASFECPNNGIFADEPSGCQAYHVCQSGAQVQQKFQCPLGTLFNNVILTCDFAHNVQCGSSKGRDPFGGSTPLSTTVLLAASPDENGQPQQQQQQQQPEIRMRRPTVGQARRPAQQQAARVQESPVTSERQPPLDQSQFRQPKSRPSALHQAQNSQAHEQSLQPAQLPELRPNQKSNQQQQTGKLHSPLPYSAPPPRDQLARAAPQQQQQQQQRPRPLQPDVGFSAPVGQIRTLDEALGDRDMATQSSPSFQSQGEQTQPGNKLAASTAFNVNTPQVSHQDPAQSFSLIINHVSPAASQESAPRPQLAQSRGRAIVQLPAKESPIGNQEHHFVHVKRQPTTSQSQQQPNTQGARKPLARTASSKPKPVQASVKLVHRPQTRAQVPKQQPARQASQLYSVHTDAAQPIPAVYSNQPPSAPVSPKAATLIDLTGDRSRQSVSGEALNDGMLLLVRHSQGEQQQKSSQALALDGSLVRPDSPLDAHLFPNVQQMLAAQQQQQQVRRSDADQGSLLTESASLSSAQVTAPVTPTTRATTQSIGTEAPALRQENKQRLLKKVKKLRTTQAPGKQQKLAASAAPRQPVASSGARPADSEATALRLNPKTDRGQQ